MSDISNYAEAAILNHVFRNHAAATEHTRTNIFVGLVSNAATDANLEEGLLTHEIDGYSGDRPQIEFTPPVQEDGKAVIKNADRIEFVDMPAVTVRYAILCDSATKGAGNVLWRLRLNEDKVANADDVARIESEELEVTLD